MLFRLVDTEGCWTVAESAIFAEHGHPFGPEQKALVIGRTVEAAGEAMAQYLGRPGAGSELAAKLLARVRKELSRGAMALTGAAELVRACRRPYPSPWRATARASCWTRRCGRPVSPAISPTRSPPTRCTPRSPRRSSTSRHAKRWARPPTLRRLRGLGHGYRLGTRRRAVRRRGAVPARHRPRPRLAGVQPGRTQVAGLGRRASRQQGLTRARHRTWGRGVRLRRPRHRLPRRPWRGSRACRPPRSAFRRHRAPGRTFPQWRPLVRPHPEVVALERL